MCVRVLNSMYHFHRPESLGVVAGTIYVVFVIFCQLIFGQADGTLKVDIAVVYEMYFAEDCFV